MNNEYFAEMHRLIEKAKTFERMGREEEALNLYLEIHAKYFPNTSDLYERPAILLEKRKRFDEAIQICEKAIKLINEGKITGIKDNFVRRIERINARADYHQGKGKHDGSKKQEHAEKAEKPPKAPKAPKPPKEPKAPREPREPFKLPSIDWAKLKSFKLPKFTLTRLPHQSKDERVPFDFKAFLARYKKFRKPTRTEAIVLGLIVVFIGSGFYAIMNKPKSQYEIMIDMSEFKDSGLEGNPFAQNQKELPPITPTMIDAAVKATKAMSGVREAGIIVQKEVVGFVVMLNPGTGKGEAKAAAEVFVKTLGSAAAAENPELSPPGTLGYGELFDYYTLLVVAGENYDNLLLKGSKNPKALGIYWRSE